MADEIISEGRERIFGIETEYGHEMLNPNRRFSSIDKAIQDFMDFKFSGFTGRYLRNGSRVYLDGSHVECATPETSSVLQTILYDKAMEKQMAVYLNEFNSRYCDVKSGERLMFFKNNTDYHGNSQGCHENYLLPPKLWEILTSIQEHRFSRLFLIFLAVRQVLCGSGTISNDMKFLLSQRSVFIKGEWDQQTKSSRPIINQKREPLADGNKFARLHLILGDSNMSEWSSYLKIGTTHLLLKAFERLIGFGSDIFPKILIGSSIPPLRLLREVNNDILFQHRYCFGDISLSVLDIHQILMDFVEKTLADSILPGEKIILAHWREFISKIKENDYTFLSSRLDWAIKKSIIERKLERSDINPKILVNGIELFFGKAIKQAQVIDLWYHDISANGIYNQLDAKGAIINLLTDYKNIKIAAHRPPKTRAAWRGETLSYIFYNELKYKIIIEITWDCIKITTGKFSKIFTNPNPWRSDWSDIAYFLQHSL